MKIQLILYLLSVLHATGFPNRDIQVVDRGRIEVSISGLKNNHGQVGILLFDRQEGFPATREKAVREILLPIQNGNLRHTFTDVPFGEYAVSVMHDENLNKKLDVNFFGMPTEGNGVSNNVKNRLGPPKFGQAAFKFDRPSYSVAIKIQY